jgi:hypothetical protein
LLKIYLKKLKEISRSSKSVDEYLELHSIIKHIFDKKRSDKINSLQGGSVGGTILKASDSLRIKCLAPLGKVLTKYANSFANDKLPDQNLISAIIEIEIKAERLY